MGIFKNKKLSIHCDNCRKKINDYEFVWIDEHKFCQVCAAKIQGGAPNSFVHGGPTLQGQNSDFHNYEMVVEDIFFVNNKGTVLCGTVKKGKVRLNDIVCIGGKKYSVIGIECAGTLLAEALCGMNIGLLISCLTPHIFSVGALVTGLPEEVAPVKNEPVSSEVQSSQAFSDADISELKKYAFKFLPQPLNTPHDYKTVVDTMSGIIPTINVSIMDANIKNIIESNDLSGLSIGEFYPMLAQEIEKWLGVTNKEKVIETLQSLDDDIILTVWISLDMFGFALKDGSKDAIDDFCKSIIDVIAKRGLKAPEPTVPETAVPETAAPETIAPEAMAPEAIVPEAIVPETAVTEMAENDLGQSVPLMAAPGIDDLETAAPLMTAPQMDVTGTDALATDATQAVAPAVAEPVTTEPQNYEAPSEFEVLQKRCVDLTKVVPGSEELAGLKSRLGQMILELEEIWVAYDADFKSMYPYVASNGRMEVFTKESYANGVKEYYASCHEGNLEIVKKSKDEIKKFFEDTLYMGIIHFTLDNGVAPLDMNTEDFCPYTDEAYLDRKNRAIRCYLMRYMQTLHRYNKISDSTVMAEKTKDYQNILSAYLSAGATALANGVVYALGPGPFAEGISLYTEPALEKIKSFHNEKGIYDDSYMVCPGDTNYAAVGTFTFVETIKNPSLGEFVAVFTDKSMADKVRLDFKNIDPQYDYNIIAMTFDEVARFALECDGMIVDMPTYAHIIEKSKLSDILSQSSAQQG